MSKQAILLTELKSGIGTLTFNRPERKKFPFSGITDDDS
jgi:hypothetical protein